MDRRSTVRLNSERLKAALESSGEAEDGVFARRANQKLLILANRLAYHIENARVSVDNAFPPLQHIPAIAQVQWGFRRASRRSIDTTAAKSTSEDSSAP